MKSKKIISIVLLLALVFTFCACGEKKETKSLLEHGLDVIDLMLEGIRSEEYIEIFISDEEIIEVLTETGKGDYSEPDKVFEIKISEEAMSDLMDMTDFDDLSEELQKVLMNKMLSSVATQLNARSSTAHLAANSVASMGKTFVFDDEEFENCIYLYVYEDAKPVVVTFIAGEDGVVSAVGSPILLDGMEWDSKSDIKDNLGLPDIYVKVLRVDD